MTGDRCSGIEGIRTLGHSGGDVGGGIPTDDRTDAGLNGNAGGETQRLQLKTHLEIPEAGVRFVSEN